MLVQRIRFDTPAYYHGRERAVAEYPDFTPTRVGHGAGVSRSGLHARSVSVDYCPSARLHLAQALRAKLV